MANIASESPTHPAAGRPEAAAAIWDWKGERAPLMAGPTAGQMRRHGALQAFIAGCVGLLIFFFWHRTLAYVVWSIASLSLLLALLSPLGLYKGLRRGLELFSHYVGRVLSWVLLVPLFFAFFGIFGGLLRRGKRDKMERWFDQRSPSYWTKRDDETRNQESYERQF